MYKQHSSSSELLKQVKGKQCACMYASVSKNAETKKRELTGTQIAKMNQTQLLDIDKR